MNWHELQKHEESLEKRRNELITKELQGKMKLSFKSIVALLNSKRKVKL